MNIYFIILVAIVKQVIWQKKNKNSWIEKTQTDKTQSIRANEGQLNEHCGAEHVQKTLALPANVTVFKIQFELRLFINN